MNRNEWNSKTKSVFWLVAEKIHKLWGISPGVPWGYFRPQEGSNPMADSKNEFLRPICIFVNWVVSVSDNFALPVTLYSYSLYVFISISYFFYTFHWCHISCQDIIFHFALPPRRLVFVSRRGLAFLSARVPLTIPSHTDTGATLSTSLLTPLFIAWLLNQPQNGPWLLILLWAINFSTIMVILNYFWPLGGLLGAPSNLWGPPRASMSSLTSKDTLPPGLISKQNGHSLLILLWFSNFFLLLWSFLAISDLWGASEGLLGAPSIL